MAGLPVCFGAPGAARLSGRAASLLVLWSVVAWPEMLQPVKPTGRLRFVMETPSCIALHCKDVMRCEVARLRVIREEAKGE